MKLKQALIEGGIAYGNPEMEYPIAPNTGKMVTQESADFEIAYQEAVKKWNSGRLPFEDQKTIDSIIFSSNVLRYGHGEIGKKMPDGLYSVDLDVTVVEQTRRKDLVPCAIWQDGTTQIKLPNYEYRKVLRIN